MVMHRNRRGVALIFVLCLLIILGAVATEVGRAARLEAHIVESVRSRTVARYAAESGVVAALAGIEGLLDSLPESPDRAAAFRDLGARMASLADVHLGGARFGVAVSDLNARIDLNRSDPETVLGLFRQFTSDRQAQVIVASLQAKPLERVGELGVLPGITDALALAVAPYVTVWGDGIVNINSAPEPVLAALPGIGEAEARTIVARRAAGEVFTSSAPDPQSQDDRVTITSAPLGALVVTEPSRLLIVARGWRDGSPLTHEIQAVYAIVGAHLTLHAWQERDL